MLSDLTVDAVLDALTTPDPARMCAIASIREAAGLDAVEADGDTQPIVAHFDAWLRGNGPRLWASSDTNASRRLCQPAAANAMARVGVNPWALLVVTRMTPGHASIDWWPDDGPFPLIASMSPDGERDELMMPLGPGVQWTGDALLLAPGMLPDTLLAAAAGRRADEIVAHPLMASAGIVTGLGEDVGAWRRLQLDGGRWTRWANLGACSNDR